MIYQLIRTRTLNLVDCTYITITDDLVPNKYIFVLGVQYILQQIIKITGY